MLRSSSKWYRTNRDRIETDVWRHENTFLAQLCARYCQLSLDVWPLLHALEMPDKALRQRCLDSAALLYDLSHASSLEKHCSRMTSLNLIYDRCLLLARHGDGTARRRATDAAANLIKHRTFSPETCQSIFDAIQRVHERSKSNPVAALPVECVADHKLKRLLRKADISALNELLCHWDWALVLELKTHCLLHLSFHFLLSSFFCCHLVYICISPTYMCVLS